MLTIGILTKIPLPGGSGRVPSGAMQFQDDWPGLFIRGDQAVDLGSKVKALLEASKERKLDDVRVWAANLELERLAEVIEQDVRVK